MQGKKQWYVARLEGWTLHAPWLLKNLGVEATLNGRNQQTLLAAAEQIREGLNKGVQIAVIDIGTEQGQDIVVAKYLKPDILIYNNGGPPFVEFKSLSRSDLEKGLEMNMITPIRMIQRIFNSMAIKGFR
ncbi:MAG: hypothetical protein CMK30_03375 [Porticoccaceae bacterium]|nr:hypothetical protein [Porticoccaceae bacterium]